jgi:hypothetical protein
LDYGFQADKDDILKESSRRRLQIPNIPVPGRSSRVQPRDTTDAEDAT